MITSSIVARANGLSNCTPIIPSPPMPVQNMIPFSFMTCPNRSDWSWLTEIWPLIGTLPTSTTRTTRKQTPSSEKVTIDLALTCRRVMLEMFAGMSALKAERRRSTMSPPKHYDSNSRPTGDLGASLGYPLWSPRLLHGDRICHVKKVLNVKRIADITFIATVANNQKSTTR